MATHSSILAWRVPWIEEPGGLQSMQRIKHHWSDLAHMEHAGKWASQWKWALVVKILPANAEDIRDSRFNPWVRKIPWRRKWQPTPVFLPGKSHRQRSLVATVHRVTKSQTQKKWLSMHSMQGKRQKPGYYLKQETLVGLFPFLDKKLNSHHLPKTVVLYWRCFCPTGNTWQWQEVFWLSELGM